MPTENELKYVLKLKSEDQFDESSKFKRYSLHQGYLAFAKGMTLRLRSSQEFIENKLDGQIKRKLCYKQKINNRVVEIEKRLDERDFEDLWTACLNKVQKKRYVFIFKKCTWDIDFFKNHYGETYFAMAECEMPEGQVEPEFIPDIIQKNLLYAVPVDNDQYSTKRLACEQHAKKLYKKLIHDKKDCYKITTG